MEKIIYPPAETPVNIKNFLSLPSTFCFRVKNIKVPPNKSRRAPEIIIKNKLIYPLSAGMNIVHTITTKTPINRYSITVNIFPLIFIDYILPRACKVVHLRRAYCETCPQGAIRTKPGATFKVFLFILIIFKDLTKMESINGIDYGHREKLWTPKQSPEKDFPIINSFFPYYAQMPDRFK